MTSQPEKQLIAMRILNNISRSNVNQTMEFGQLREYNIREKFFLKNHTQNGMETLFLRINSGKFTDLTVCQVEGYLNILKRSYGPLAFTSYKAFLKNKESSGTSLPTSFSA